MSKSVTRIDRKSLSRDSETLRQFRLRGILADPFASVSSVYMRYTSTETDASVVAQELISQGVNPLFQPLSFSPAPWERASPFLKAVYASLVMVNGNQGLKAVTVRIGQERINAAHRSTEKPLQQYRREIARRLRSALSRPVDFWFTIEGAAVHQQAGDKDHLHGVIAMSTNEENEVKRALRKFGRYDPPANAVRVKPLYNLVGWPAYASKDTRLGTANATDITMTQSLIAPARSLYEHHRSIYGALVSSLNAGTLDDAA